MKLFKFIKSNILFIAIILVVSFSIFTIYSSQSKMLSNLEEEKTEKERILEEAETIYQRVLNMEKEMNTNSAKEKQIRERLNMIKNDEIQFVFTD